MNPLVKLVASALPGEKKYVLFAGAGVSKDAGIPTAWDLMMKTASLLYVADNDAVDPSINLEDWFIKSDYSQMQYSELVEKIYPKYPDQQDFLKKYIDNYKLGQAHKGIAELVRRGIIRSIITTNFDHYIEKALEEIGLEPQVISTDEDLKNSVPLIHCKSARIYKPHGNLGHGALRNTPKDLENLSPLMEEELIKVLSDHGVIVLGYSGRDVGIQKLFENRSYNYYPLFWVNPSPPEGDIEELLKAKDYTYIPCTGASQFINDYLQLLERLKSLAPPTGSGPAVPELKYALSSSREPVAQLYSQYLDNINVELEQIRPDFSKYDERDDSIVEQINRGITISCRFIEAALLASEYGNLEAIVPIYEFFGKAYKLYSLPDGFSGKYQTIDFDGYKFLVYEMFVSFIASLIKNNRWDIIGELLNEDLFVERERGSNYVSHVSISEYIRSLDEIRNKRLNLRRLSVMADFIEDRFTNGELSRLIKHKDFLEADYFLFMRSICHEMNLENLWNVWCPRSCVYLKGAPSYIVKAESQRFLENIVKAVGFRNKKEFIENFKRTHSHFTRYFTSGWKDDPLNGFDLDRLGSRN
ncbi:MAG: SIR2 family protein [Chloroflexi bacterium]|nr:SIR2 family protein [Chloroflexota bacterium]